MATNTTTTNGQTEFSDAELIAMARESLAKKAEKAQAREAKKAAGEEPNGPHIFLRTLADAMLHASDVYAEDPAGFVAWIMRLQPRFDLVADFGNITTSADFKNLAGSITKAEQRLPA